MIGMLASRLLPPLLPPPPLPPAFPLVLDRPGMPRPEKSPPMMGMFERKFPPLLPLLVEAAPVLVFWFRRFPTTGMLLRKLLLPPLLLLLLEAALLEEPLRRSPTMGMLSRLRGLLPLLPLLEPLRRSPTMGMLSRLRAPAAPPLLLLLLLAPSPPPRRGPTMGRLSRLRSPTKGMLSRRPWGAGAERVPAEKRATDRINELNRFILKCDVSAIDRSHFV